MVMRYHIDAVSNMARDIRKDYHLTLGKLIAELKAHPNPDASVFPSANLPVSYRGYYTDLALQPTYRNVTVRQLLKELSSILDTALPGYGGGQYLMDENTPLWLASYGNLGPAIIGFEITSFTIKLITKEIL